MWTKFWTQKIWSWRTVGARIYRLYQHKILTTYQNFHSFPVGWYSRDSDLELQLNHKVFLMTLWHYVSFWWAVKAQVSQKWPGRYHIIPIISEKKESIVLLHIFSGVSKKQHPQFETLFRQTFPPRTGAVPTLGRLRKQLLRLSRAAARRLGRGSDAERANFQRQAIEMVGIDQRKKNMMTLIDGWSF